MILSFGGGDGRDFPLLACSAMLLESRSMATRWLSVFRYGAEAALPAAAKFEGRFYITYGYHRLMAASRSNKRGSALV
jgi:hypothetical protein